VGKTSIDIGLEHKREAEFTSQYEVGRGSLAATATSGWRGLQMVAFRWYQRISGKFLTDRE